MRWWVPALAGGGRNVDQSRDNRAERAADAHRRHARAALADEISRLHEHLRPSAAPRQPGRNLFSFLPRQAPVAPSSPPSLQKPALSESIAARPAAPVMKLSGIAEDVTAGGVVRTAIISAFGQLFVVKEGELVTERYRVTRISADVAELSDVMDGTVVRIALR